MSILSRVLQFFKAHLDRPSIWSILILLVIVLPVSIALYAESRQPVKPPQKTAPSTTPSNAPKSSHDVPASTEKSPETITNDASTTILKASDFQRPRCEQLQGRTGITITNQYCDYKLNGKGTLTMGVVFIHDKDYDANEFKQLTGSNVAPGSLRYINTYLRAQAERYRVTTEAARLELTFFGPYKTTEAVGHLSYQRNPYKLLGIYHDTSKRHGVPEENYDMVHYVLLDHHYGGGSFNDIHRSFTHNATLVPTFVHETLHLLGATDKYGSTACDTAPEGRDIMCDTYDLRTSDITTSTAKELGWIP